MSPPAQEHHLTYLRQTITLAQQSPPKPTYFRVGCVIVSYPSSPDDAPPQVLSTGYTLELPGNTHAEQCALSKLAAHHSTSEEQIGELLPSELNTILYTSLEPCGKRLSGNLPCVQRIIATRLQNPRGGIRKVVFGAKEPGTFVRESRSCAVLSEAGVEWEYLPVFEEEILKVAMEGHGKGEGEAGGVGRVGGGSVSAPKGSGDVNATAENLPVRNEATQPRNSKKRMMEVPPG